MSQVLQLNQTKGTVEIQSNKKRVVPAAQGADCASAPAGIRFVSRPDPRELLHSAHQQYSSTIWASEALVTLARKKLGKVVIPYSTPQERKAIHEAIRRRARLIGLKVKTLTRNGELHVYNVAVVMESILPES